MFWPKRIVLAFSDRAAYETPMDTRQLESLVAVADAGSFAGAARVVNLTASAISQQMQALESELGAALFDRRTRPPKLNGRGEELVRAARSMLRTMAEARLAISGGRSSGVLKLGSIRTISMQIVPRALAQMRPAYPDLSFGLQVGLSESLLAEVASGRLDAAIVADHVRVPAGLVWTPILEEPLVLVAPPNEAGQGEAAIACRLPFIRYEAEVPLARQISTEISRTGAVLGEAAVADTMPLVVGLVRAGLGFSVVPRIAWLDAPARTLHCTAFRAGAIRRRIGLVERRVSSRSAVLAHLRAVLADTAEAMAAAAQGA